MYIHITTSQPYTINVLNICHIRVTILVLYTVHTYILIRYTEMSKPIKFTNDILFQENTE